MKFPFLVLLALLVLAPVRAEPPSARQDMRSALAAAWQRSPQAQALAARRLEADAGAELAGLALAGAPSVVAGLRSDRLGEARGRRDEEIGVALPLWLPGQRDARQVLAVADGVAVDADLEVERLRLAGELRERVWTAVAAVTEAELATARADSAEALALSVERRVGAGDLARVDALSARGELLAAGIARIEASARADEARQRLGLLTGSNELPQASELLPEAAHATLLLRHPRLLAAQRGRERAIAETGVARHAGRAAPELGVQFQRERDASGLDSRGSVRIEFRLPFGSDARQRPLLAAANTAQVRADAELLQVERELAAEAELAQRHLNAQQSATQLAVSRQTAAEERRQLLERAFSLGELPLAQLLTARADAVAAASAAARAAATEGLARARLNQALGVLP